MRDGLSLSFLCPFLFLGRFRSVLTLGTLDFDIAIALGAPGSALLESH